MLGLKTPWIERKLRLLNGGSRILCLKNLYCGRGKEVGMKPHVHLTYFFISEIMEVYWSAAHHIELCP